MGGYHPRFLKPAHFPDVPRLGFNWRVGGSVTVKGEAYFALTNSCVMAGGLLEASYHSGDVKAWFRVWADFLAHRRSRTYGDFMRRNLWPGVSSYVNVQRVVAALVARGFNVHELADDTAVPLRRRQRSRRGLDQPVQDLAAARVHGARTPWAASALRSRRSAANIVAFTVPSEHPMIRAISAYARS